MGSDVINALTHHTLSNERKFRVRLAGCVREMIDSSVMALFRAE
jgi:hypothetical protein